MPPKRKESSALPESSPAADPPPRSKRSRAPQGTPAKKPVGPFPIAEYEPKGASDEFTWIQRHTCQKWSSSDGPEKCMSCIEKQSHCGSCRFVNLRAFREKVDAKGATRHDWSDYCFRGNLTDPPLAVVEKVKKSEGAKKKEKKVIEEKKLDVFEGGNRRTSRRSTRRTSGMDIDEPERGSEPARSVATDDVTGDVEVIGLEGRDPKVFASPPMKANKEHGDYAKPLIRETFVYWIEKEIEHENSHWSFDGSEEGKEAVVGAPRPLIRIQNSLQARTTCDMCAASIFKGSYMCGCCGREFCLSCWTEWEPSDTIDNRWPLPRDKCSRRRRHVRKNFVFVTRAEAGELEKLLEHVQTTTPAPRGAEDEKIKGSIKLMRATAWSGVDGPLYRGVPHGQYADVPLEKFQALWRVGGVPLVLQGMLERFRLPWDPDYMIRHYGDESCIIHDCADDTEQPGKVKQFFASFATGGAESYKLKDWPPQDEFKDTFPDLFTDFENAVPYPEYTRRSGPLNLASFFPPGSNAPDLGPKMYNAYPSPDFLPVLDDETEESVKERTSDVKGTTNLHLDLTDAVNIMLYASGGHGAPELATRAKAIPMCGAIWDIFAPDYADKLRSYLHAKYPDDAIDDPIHRQQYYLSETDLLALRDEGVLSYRIYQNPGEAVFIPAGCPHQVRNRMNCIKVAVDFLSPENARICRTLLEEGRAMAPKDNRARGRDFMKEDVLQLWEACRLAWDAFTTAPPGPPRPPPPPPRPKHAPAPIAPMGMGVGWRIPNGDSPPPAAKRASPTPATTTTTATTTPSVEPDVKRVRTEVDVATPPKLVAAPPLAPVVALASPVKRKADDALETPPAEKRTRSSSAGVRPDVNGIKDRGWPRSHRALVNPYCVDLL